MWYSVLCIRICRGGGIGRHNPKEVGGGGQKPCRYVRMPNCKVQILAPCFKQLRHDCLLAIVPFYIFVEVRMWQLFLKPLKCLEGE